MGTPPGTLTTRTLAAFASPAVPIAGVGLPLVVYLPPFYAEQMGLGLAVVGTIFMVTRLGDVIADPLAGLLSDRWRTRWGRRRHLLVVSVPLLVVSVHRVFMPVPPVTGGYLLGWLAVLYVGWTLLTLSHMSWGAELTPDYHERSRVQGWREVFLIAGMITVLVLPAVIERTDGASSGVDRVAAMGWFIIVLLPATVAWAVATVGERAVPDPPRIGWRRAVAIVARNRPLRRVLLTDLVAGFGGGIVAALFLFVAEDRLRLGTAASALLLCYFLSGALFVPVMIRVSYRFGKHRTLAGSALFNALTPPLLYLIPEGNVLAALGVFVLVGANMGVGPFLFRSITADVADHDRVESGAQRTGLYYAMLTMTNKIGQALCVGIVYPVLEWVGYVPGAANTAAAVDALAAVYVWAPAGLSLVVARFMWRFPLDMRRQEELRGIIEGRLPAAAP